MEIVWEIEQELADGNNPTVFHIPENHAVLLYTELETGVFYYTQADTTMGEWEDRIFSEPVETAVEPDLENIRSEILANGYTWIVWKSGNKHRVAMYPYFSVGFAFHPKIEGSILEGLGGFVKIDGQWCEILGGFVKVDGQWCEVV